MTRALPALLLLLLAIAIGACGDDDESDSGSSTAPVETTATVPQQTQTQPQAGGSETDLSTKPAIERPTGSPPAKLKQEDIVKGKGKGKGKGKAAKKGDNVSVQYVGVSYSTGQEFDASWDRGEPFQFELGSGMVIPGWDEGVPGMKKGGRRKLTIPPDLAYGAEGSPPAIGPNETLVFVIDLLEVE